jgi:hypothetical protein
MSSLASEVLRSDSLQNNYAGCQSRLEQAAACPHRAAEEPGLSTSRLLHVFGGQAQT